MPPSSFQPPLFDLEDFHREFEHLPDMVTLATSDTQPWSWRDALELCPAMADALDAARFGYPDAERELVPEIWRLYQTNAEAAVLPTNGAAEGIFLALSAVRGNSSTRTRVAVPTPAYGAFAGVSEILGYQVERYRYEADKDWQTSDEDLLQAADQCDVVVVNSPHNPTGHVMPIGLLMDVAHRLRHHGGWLLLDEVFRWAHDGHLEPLFSSNVVSIRSLSKLYGLPGLRLGWLTAPKSLVDVMRTLQQYSTASIGAMASKMGCTILPCLALLRSRDLSCSRPIELTCANGRHITRMSFASFRSRVARQQ